VQSTVRQHDLRNVHVLGYKSGRDLAELFRGAALVVVPSEWYENCPMTILEAFAYGKPVIASDVGGMPELIEPTSTGMVFPAGNAEQLRACIESLYGDRESIAAMGRRARARVESDFSAQTHCRNRMSAQGLHALAASHGLDPGRPHGD
jgi:glycosyltransferase involved in cell wall biosynthesis